MKYTPLDADGQPIERAFNAARLSDRAIDQLIGLCQGVLFDGAITDSEAHALQRWLEGNRSAAGRWPGNVLYQRLQAMLADATLDADEQSELVDLLMDLTGGGLPIEERVASYSSSLPLCSPPPDVIFQDRHFCLTGKFVTGTRKKCEAAIHERGGSAQATPTLDTDFLVIGAVGSADWIHSTHGRKIERAVEMRSAGSPVRIIAEAHWVKFLL